MSRPRVVLIGAAGSGKTTVGALLAQRLSLPFRDTDADIEQVTGASPGDILVLSGEAEFRRRERAAVKSALRSAGVVAVGGGAPHDPDVRAAIVAAGSPVVWLRVTPPNAIARVGLNLPRPVGLGNVRAQVAALMKMLEPHYSDLASLAVDTDYQELPDVVAEIVRKLQTSDQETDKHDKSEASVEPATSPEIGEIIRDMPDFVPDFEPPRGDR